MRRTVLALLAIVACRGNASETPRSIPGSAAPAKIAVDPWAGSGAALDDAPTLLERKQVVDGACPKVTGPAFYAIAKGGKTSYILGTRHVSVALSEFPPVVVDKLHASHLAVFEVDPQDDKDSVQPRPTETLEQRIGAARWKKLAALVGKSSSIDLVHARASEALLVMMSLYEDPSRLLEADIGSDVADHKIPTKGLETSKFQDDLIEKLLDLRMLDAALDGTSDRKEMRDETERDLREYCAGADHDPGIDPKTRREMLAAGYTAADISAMEDQLVYARNRDWIPKLEALFAQGDVFVAVGADHLLGPRGVIALLGKDGYAATRITK